jgi:ABC-2 type transport system permease protein
MNFHTRAFTAVFKKELKHFFQSPLSYVLSSLFVLLTGWLAYNFLVQSHQLQSQSILQVVVYPYFVYIKLILAFMTPLLTMHLWAGEKKQKTIDLLIGAPVSLYALLLGKLLATFVFLLFLISFTTVFPIVLMLGGFEESIIFFTSYLGLILTVFCYISVGMLASSLTENQMMAATMSFIFLFFFYLIVLSAGAFQNPAISQMLQYMSFLFHYEGFLRGVIKTSNLVFYTTFTGICLIFTKHVLSARSW